MKAYDWLVIGAFLVVAAGIIGIGIWRGQDHLPAHWSEVSIRRMCREEIQDAGARWAP